jgi:hypothetical protein
MTTIAVIAVAGAVAGCAQDQWYNPSKSADEVKADLKACNDLAQENTLERRGTDRVNYGSATRMPQPPSTLPTGQAGNVGETPRELNARVTTENSFDRERQQCMRDKGYTLGKQGS